MSNREKSLELAVNWCVINKLFPENNRTAEYVLDVASKFMLYLEQKQDNHSVQSDPVDKQAVTRSKK